MNAAICDQIVEVAFGKHREDKMWVTRRMSFEALLEQHFVGFTRGPKDGPAMTQGALMGPQRKAKAVRACSLVMLDHDTGETMDEIAAAIEARGLAAVLWHTYSHLKPETEIAESKLVQFLRKDLDWVRDRSPSMDDAVLVRQCADFLRKNKKIAPAVLDTITSVTKGLTAKGMLYTVHHGPMPRVRSLFVLEQPFDFAARGGTQDDAIDEWKDRYAGLSTTLGLPFDPSCVDPSRLMYLPRIPRDADESLYEIRPIDGRMLTIDDMPRLTESDKANKAASNPLAAAMERLGGAAQQTKWKTKGLTKWLAEHANDFEAEEFFEAYGLENRGPTTTGTCFECPTDNMHTDPGNPDDKGFFAQNASAREGGFACSCSHASCRTAAQAATGKIDRAWFLDEFCAARGLTVDDLLDYCPSYTRREDQRIETEIRTADTIDAAISILSRETPVDHIIDVLRLLAETPNDLISDDRLGRIKTATGKGIKTLREQLASLRAERDAAAATGGGGDDNNEIRDQHPAPDDGSDAALIWNTWGYSDTVRVVRERLIAKNTENPAIFRRPEGGYCRVSTTGRNLRFRDIVETSDWINVVSKHMRFMKAATERAPETEVAPFREAIAALQGDIDLPFGVIDRVVEVPVFNDKGGVRTTKGYDPDASVWFEPKLDFFPVPDEVTADDVTQALSIIDEMYIDFPFSDCYASADPAPIKWVGEDGDEILDDDGHPVPNYERGKASRANTYAMLLQPFARSLIAGPTPVFFIDKPAAGTGAGYLADTLGFALFGHKMPAQTVPPDETELRKQIVATLRQGSPAIFLDNLNHELDSGALASALSTGVFEGRVLGQSEMVRTPIRSTWIIAANNGKLSHELMRRVVPIRLDAGVPNPAADRKADSYKYNLAEFCTSRRADIVWACHVLIRNWWTNAKGVPHRAAVIQTFEDWSGVMGGILHAAGVEGFLTNVPAYLKERGEEVADETAFIQRLYERNGAEWFGADVAFDACLMIGTTDKVDPDLNLNISGRDESGLRASLGKKMGRMLGKTFRLPSDKLVSLARRTVKGKSQYRLDPK